MNRGYDDSWRDVYKRQKLCNAIFTAAKKIWPPTCFRFIKGNFLYTRLGQKIGGARVTQDTKIPLSRLSKKLRKSAIRQERKSNLKKVQWYEVK